ncbi:hypothetical protein KJ909_01095 [Patescibacteria group bacterium]|nr:hypothetical protein [Patescibacteria group bacterium]
MNQEVSFFLSLSQSIFAFLGSLIYSIFALVIVKQVKSMSKNVYDKFNRILIIFSYLHFVFSLVFLFSAFLLLIT